MTNYILMLLFSDDGKHVVTLQKKHGPAFLKDKWTFPGGHIEASDQSPLHAASREMEEEADVVVPVADWRNISYVAGDDYTLTAVAARSANAKHARAMTDEPVRYVPVEAVLADALSSPQSYSPDFIKLLTWGKSHLAISSPA